MIYNNLVIVAYQYINFKVGTAEEENFGRLTFLVETTSELVISFQVNIKNITNIAKHIKRPSNAMPQKYDEYQKNYLTLAAYKTVVVPSKFKD